MESAWKLQPKAPHYLMWYLVLLHGGIILMVSMLPLIMIVKLGACLFLSVSLNLYYHRYLKPSGSRYIRTLQKDKAGVWSIEYGSNNTLEGLLLQRSVVWPYWIILYLKPAQAKPWQTCAIWLHAQQLEASDMHRLRLYCRDPKTYQR